MYFCRFAGAADASPSLLNFTDLVKEIYISQMGENVLKNQCFTRTYTREYSWIM